MPKKKVTVTYLCEICSEEHQSRISALLCEREGVAVPEFKRFEVAELFGFSDKEQKVVNVSSGARFKVGNGMKVVVHDDGGDRNGFPNPHLLPAYYEVWIQTIRGLYRKELASFSRENLRKVKIKDGTICPLCGSRAETAKEMCSPVLTFGSEFSLLSNASIQKCLNCGGKFFTAQQLRVVEMFIKKNSKWPLANTRRLVEERRFQY
jgi:DNA-directed RNA polymerase subunit RPC12/RpoP